MNDAAAGGHPLDVAGGDGAAIAHAVAMLHGAGQHVSNGLNAAMRMPRETGQVVLRNIVAEIIEQKEWIEIRRVAESERATQMHARAFERRLRFDQPLHGTKGHGTSTTKV